VQVTHGHFSPVGWWQVSPRVVWPGHSLSSIFRGVLEFIHPDLGTVKVRAERGGGQTGLALKLHLLLLPTEDSPLAGLGVPGGSVEPEGTATPVYDFQYVQAQPPFPGQPPALGKGSSVEQFQCCEERTRRGGDCWPSTGWSCHLRAGLGQTRPHPVPGVVLSNPVLEGEGEAMEDASVPVKEGEVSSGCCGVRGEPGRYAGAGCVSVA